jgi:HSP20 family protein
MYNKREFKRHCNPKNFSHYKNFSGHRQGAHWGMNFMDPFSTPPANVLEKDDKYELHLFAPGYKKKDFLIALIDQKISISAKKEALESGENWKRKEYIPRGFDRQFELNDKIDRSNIIAKYENGVLMVSLPKMEGFETLREEIKIA